MTTIYTTLRCLTVKEPYEVVISYMNNERAKALELTEVIHSCSYGLNSEDNERTTERTVYINKSFVVEVTQ